MIHSALVFALFVATAYAATVNDANSFCFSVQDRRNQKDLYADDECHHYIQCFFLSSTEAVGFRRSCPSGQFWHDDVMTCMPEGRTPCTDRCLDDATHTRGCYAGSGCRQFFVCSNTGSYGMCCPQGTSFNEQTCSCDESATCADACQMQAPAVATTVAPARQLNDTTCIDSFGSTVSSDPVSNIFHLIDANGHSTGDRYCVAGYAFNIVTCRCDIESGVTIPPQTGLRRAALWLPFNGNAHDESINQFSTFLYNGAKVDTTEFATGSGGSLWVNGGRMEIPGFSSFDSRSAGSWCAFFKCSDGTCENNNGGIIANAKSANDNGATLIAGVNGASSLKGSVNLWHPAGTRSVSSSITAPGWNHMCLTYNGNTVNLWSNGAVTASQNVGGQLRISHAPLAIGNDQTLGTFSGHIDDVLVTGFAMTDDEIAAHRNGDGATLAARGFFDASLNSHSRPGAASSRGKSKGQGDAQNNNNGQSGSTHRP